MKVFLGVALLASALLFGCLSSVPIANVVFQCTSEQSVGQMTTTVTFANTGGAAGSSCVDVKLFDRNNLENSQIVCSGQVEPGTSKVETARFGLAVLGDKQYSVKCDRMP